MKNPSPENEDGVNYEDEEITDDNVDDDEKYDPEVCIMVFFFWITFLKRLMEEYPNIIVLNFDKVLNKYQ